MTTAQLCLFEPVPIARITLPLSVPDRAERYGKAGLHSVLAGQLPGRTATGTERGTLS